MKKVRLLAVGKLKEDYLAAGMAEYAKRLQKYCAFSVTELADSAATDAVRRESDALLARLDGYTVLCDPRGQQMSSTELAAALDRAYLHAPAITFVVGGSAGVDDRVRARADLIVSFGRVTYPHQLFRLLLTEQIYRCFTITAGTPYHK